MPYSSVRSVSLLADSQHAHREESVRMPLSGSRVEGDLTAKQRTREAPRRQAPGTRSRLTFGQDDRGPRPAKTTRGSLNDIGTQHMPAEALVETPGRSRKGDRGRRSGARSSLSGSCAGDYLTATTVKEKPRRQTTGTRLRVTIGHDDRGPRPPVCAHGPLNDIRAISLSPLASSSHSRLRRCRLPGAAATFRNTPAARFVVRCRPRSFSGTSHRRTAFQ